MTPDQRIQIGELWLNVASMYGRDIPRGALSIMLNAIDDLPFDRIGQVLIEWVKSGKNRSHPLPGDIRALVHPQVDNDSQAREAASRIVHAVSKFGWNNTEPAKKYIGELGWHIVERFGGWSYVCQNLGVTIDLTTFQAQARDLAKATQVMGAAGKFDQPPALPSGSEKVQNLLNMTQIKTI